jgi:signal peptidase I
VNLVTQNSIVSNDFLPYDKAHMELRNTPITDLRDTHTPPTVTPTGPRNPNDAERESSWLEVIWETVRYALVALVIIVPVRIFVAQPFIVSGSSMYPTYHNGEYLIVNETIKYIGEYERGDVVILRYPNDPSKYFIKRVIGLPGETVTIRNGIVSITSPTRTTPLVLNEPYVKNQKVNENSSRTLSNDEFFVMGDNRSASSDSRVWGPVPRRLMNGEAFLRLFPVSAIALHPGSLQGFGISYE